MATYLPPPVQPPVDVDVSGIKHARFAQFAKREYIARTINAIKKKHPTFSTPRSTGSLGVDAGYFGHLHPLFGSDSPFQEKGDVDPRSLPDLQNRELYPIWPPALRDPTRFHVGIVGAGMAGLYTAMILDSLEITYEIIEASNRIGGRVYTHRFTDDPGDYYDAGAMRFPENPIMDLAFDLFARLKIEKNSGPVESQLQGQLIPYYLEGPANPSYFHNILVLPVVSPIQDRAGKSEGSTVPDKYVDAGPDKVLSAVPDDWKKKWAKDPYATWLAIKDEKDAYAVSARQEILRKIRSGDAPLPAADVCQVGRWRETLRGSTFSNDQALVEASIHSMDFVCPVVAPVQGSYTVPLAAGDKWWCLNGGAGILAQKMAALIGESKILRGTRVIAISRDQVTLPARPMQVLCDQFATPKRYSHVITTTTTPCLQAMDLSKAGLSYAQREAIRVLRYNPAVKLGIKFSAKWWITKGINKGGQGKTDRPTRTVVYPSYALNDPEDGPGVLLACYNVSTDAARLGGLARGNDPTNQKLILDIVLRDLALMHDEPYEKLRNLVVSHHFHDWSRDEFAFGAWGEFGPGQFTAFFGPLQQPAAGGGLYFAGEITSIYHGWIAAALKSAHRSVFQMLWGAGQGRLIDELERLWGLDPEQDRNTTDWLVALGSLAADLDL